MFNRITIDMIGTILINNRDYLCECGKDQFKATFQYGYDEYWWIDPETGKEVHVARFMPNESQEITNS